MKKKILFIFVTLVSVIMFALSACTSAEAKDYTDDYKEIYSAHSEISKKVARSVSENIALPTSVEGKDVTITWESSNPELIDNSGHVLKTPSVTTEVEFKYTIKSNEDEKIFKEYTMKISVASLTLAQAEEELKSYFPAEVSEDISLPNSIASGAIKYSLTSSDGEYLNENGMFSFPPLDTDVTLEYVLSDGNSELKGNIIVKCLAKPLEERFEDTKNWLDYVAMNELYLDSDTVLPKSYEETGATIYWHSSIDDILNDDYTIKQYVYRRYTTLTAAVKIEDTFMRYRYYVSIAPLDISNMTEEEITANFIESIAQTTYSRLVFNQTGYIANPDLEPYEYLNIDQSYGFIDFYTGISVTPIDLIAPLDSASGHDNRPGTLKPSIEYVCVHDTADTGATAYQEANYVYGGGGGTSWHYTVDSTTIYHQIPNEEVAYHAGDGTRFFALLDTGIKATSQKPYIALDEKGYFTINGESTEIRPFTGSNAQGIYEEDPTIYTTEQLGHCKITCEIGENGNYFLGRTYFNNTYKLISNFGGNRNSIGIESCVIYGKDYATTTRNIADLCSNLCIEYELDVDRVVPHHYFSGKPCGNAFLLADKWHDFHDMVSLMVFGKTVLKDFTFNWTADSSNITSTGLISMKAKVGDVVKYSVTVLNASKKQVYANSFETKLA